jgi:gluconolactonase
MNISRTSIPALLGLAWAAGASAASPDGTAPAVPALVEKIRGELAGAPTEDSMVHSGVPHGEFVEGTITDSKIYPGTENAFKVYVPAQYDPAKPACLLVRLDGLGKTEPTVFDNLIAKGQMPVTIAVGLSSGTVWKTRGTEAYRWNRSYEFDSTDGNFPRFVIDELLPRVESLSTPAGRPIRLSHDAKDRAVMGASTGGIGSFTLAWERPDSFSRVYSMIGTFVSMRGGNDYPAIVRKTEPKPIRVFLEDGTTDAWNPLFGSWFMANENMEAALAFSGYDVQHAWGTHGHDGGPGGVILPDVMRWLWRGWPQPVGAGLSRNDMLASILRPGEAWERVAGDDVSVAGLASNPQGEVYFSDTVNRTLNRIGIDGTALLLARDIPAVRGEACGPDGTLYAAVPGEHEVVAFDAAGKTRKVADNVRGECLLVTSRGEIYVGEPGGHPDEPSHIWKITPDGSKVEIDSGLQSASGLAFSPDGNLLFAAERGGDRVYSMVSAGDGAARDKEPFYWLHPSGAPHGSGAGEIAVDRAGDLFAATRLGIQVCDRNGRVRAILWLPFPAAGVEELCWGGKDQDILYATDGIHLFRRRLAVAGFPQWAAPIVLPKSNAG